MPIILKSDEDKVKTIIDFYVLTTKLKDTIRSGWKQWGVKRERIESVAEHVFGTCMLAIAIWSETLPDVNLSEVLTMLAIHETEEIIIGDITPFDDQSKQKVKKNGNVAVSAVFKDLVAKDAYSKLIDDYDNQATKEAVFAKKCDKLESDLMARIYTDEGILKFENGSEELRTNNEIIALKEKVGENIASCFCVYDRKYFENEDDVFLKINKYLENTQILKGRRK